MSRAPTCLIECIAEARAPTVRELDTLAAQIWEESAGGRSAFSWGRLDPASLERVSALRSAVLAFNGAEAE